MRRRDVEKAIKKGTRFVGRLKREQETANIAWAHFLALHEGYNASDAGWRNVLSDLSQTPRLFQIADALIRDTLMACFRLVDADERSVTLLRIHELLAKDAIRVDRLDFFETCSATSREQAQSKIDFFMGYFPERFPQFSSKGSIWPQKEWLPHKWDLIDLRSELIPIRHQLISHAGNLSKKISIKKIDAFVQLIDQLVCAAEWIFKGASASTYAARQTEAKDFWLHVRTGFK
jgi:hypothetical protein